MKRLTSLPLVAVALHMFVGCTRSVAGNETGDMLDTGGAEHTPPRGGATTTGSGDPETGGVGGRPSTGGAPNPETGGVGGRPSTGGAPNPETGGVGERPSTGGAPNPETGGVGGDTGLGDPDHLVECAAYTPPLVGACAIDAEGVFNYDRVALLTQDAGVDSLGTSFELEFAATVTDRGNAPPTTDCWSYDNMAATSGELPDGDVTFVDLEDGNGKEWHFEIVLPEYDASRFSVGDAVNVELFALQYFWGGTSARYRLSRGEELLALVVMSTESDIEVTPGTETCYEGDPETDTCGRSEYDMLASYGGEQVEIPEGESSEIGGLLVTNDEYFSLYDFGACNFGIATQFTLGAQPAD